MDSVLAFFLAFLHPAVTLPAAVPLPPRPALEAPSTEASPPAMPSPELSCKFQELAEAGQSLIVARVSGPAAATGTFVFTLHKRDAHRNTINTDDGGPYAVPADGGSVELVKARIKASPGEKIDARLQLQDAQGQTVARCSTS